MGGLALVQDGDQVLEALGLAKVSYKKTIHGLILLSTLNLLVSWFGLTCCGQDFTDPGMEEILTASKFDEQNSD